MEFCCCFGGHLPVVWVACEQDVRMGCVVHTIALPIPGTTHTIVRAIGTALRVLPAIILLSAMVE